MTFNDSPIENLDLSYYGIKNKVYVKRDDLIHPVVSGNKWRKLKYNLDHYFSISKQGIVSMGGAYSSHILSLSYICNQYSIPCVLLIRGELSNPLNDVLSKCKSFGASIKYISRENYKNSIWINNYLAVNYNNHFFIPEGGANLYGINGCQEIVNEIKVKFDYIFCEVGTGATFSGLVSGLNKNQICFGIVVLKGASNISKNISKNYHNHTNKIFDRNWLLSHDYHLGGYAKYNEKLIAFIREFYKITGLITDPIYSGKMFYGLVNELKTNKALQNKKIIALHSGGISGIEGFEKRYKIKIFS